MKEVSETQQGCIFNILPQDRGLPVLRKLLWQRAKCSVGGVYGVYMSTSNCTCTKAAEDCLLTLITSQGPEHKTQSYTLTAQLRHLHTHTFILPTPAQAHSHSHTYSYDFTPTTFTPAQRTHRLYLLPTHSRSLGSPISHWSLVSCLQQPGNLKPCFKLLPCRNRQGPVEAL